MIPKFVIYIFVFLVWQSAYCQDDFHFPDKEAAYDGGKELLNRYLDENLHYPKRAQRRQIEGIVYVSFTVGIDGRLFDIKVDGRKVFRKETLRLMLNMPLWIPAEIDGKLIEQRCKLPIKFILN